MTHTVKNDNKVTKIALRNDSRRWGIKVSGNAGNVHKNIDVWSLTLMVHALTIIFRLSLCRGRNNCGKMLKKKEKEKYSKRTRQ